MLLAVVTVMAFSLGIARWMSAASDQWLTIVAPAVGERNDGFLRRIVLLLGYVVPGVWTINAIFVLHYTERRSIFLLLHLVALAIAALGSVIDVVIIHSLNSKIVRAIMMFGLALSAVSAVAMAW